MHNVLKRFCVRQTLVQNDLGKLTVVNDTVTVHISFSDHLINFFVLKVRVSKVGNKRARGGFMREACDVPSASLPSWS